MSYSYVLDRVEDLEEKIAALEAENAKLRAVVVAAQNFINHPGDKIPMMPMEAGNAFIRLENALARLEAVE